MKLLEKTFGKISLLMEEASQKAYGGNSISDANGWWLYPEGKSLHAANAPTIAEESDIAAHPLENVFRGVRNKFLALKAALWE